MSSKAGLHKLGAEKCVAYCKKKKKNVRFYTIYLDSGVSAMKGSGEVECKLPIVQGHEIAAAHLQHLRKIRHICSLKMRRNNSYPFLCDYLM